MSKLSASGGAGLPGTTRLYTEFRQEPLCVARGGAGAATGVAGDRNECYVPGIGTATAVALEYNIIGTQTIVAPLLTSVGLDIALDNTNGDGTEWNNGITARNPLAFVVGTDGAFYIKSTFKVQDASGANPLIVGWRKAEAFTADFNDYNDLAAVGIQGTAAKIQLATIQTNAATVVTDTTQTWGDTESHTLAVYVSASGVVTYKIDDAAPTAVAAYTFTSGLTLIPFVLFKQASDVTATCEWSLFDAGAY